MTSLLPAIGDHLWQSTVFLVVVALLTPLLRRNRARVRYWLWFAASVKFLIPLAVLVVLGRQMDWQPAQIAMPPAMSNAMAVTEPFSHSSVNDGIVTISGTATWTGQLTAMFVTVWGIGCSMSLLAWFRKWRRLATIVQEATPVTAGPLFEAARHLEARLRLVRPIAIVATEASLEPGIFGIVTPVLVWPRNIGEHLAKPQVAAILSHEMCHVRYRDNLMAAVHMFVEAVFWFHPLVCWMTTRLIDERERACDEEVLSLGHDPTVYAESILTTCEHYARVPLICVSGVTGSHLTKRIEAIMIGPARETVNAWKKAALAAAALVIVGVPLVLGALRGETVRAQSVPVTTSLAFEVASVKERRSQGGETVVTTLPGGRLLATNTTLYKLIRQLYGSNGEPLQPAQIIGGPDWLTTARFDIQATVGSPDASLKDIEGMLRALIDERFKLVVHREHRLLPSYALLRSERDGRLGSRLTQVTVDCAARGAEARRDPRSAPECGIRASSASLSATAITMAQLAFNLTSAVGRSVVDETGLTGTFDLELQWSPETAGLDLPAVTALDKPSLFTAIQEQLALKLQPSRSSLEVIVIDRVQKPTEN